MLRGSITQIFAPRPAVAVGHMLEHEDLTRLLARIVAPDASGLNRVNYAELAGSLKPQLDEALHALQAVEVRELNRDAQFAYWINLYNAAVLKVVATHYPVASICDINLGGTLVSTMIGGPWHAKLVQVAGVKLSLDDIENQILRKVFVDPRLHYAINCGSIGCPNLRPNAVTASTLEADLESAAHDFINSPRGVRLTDGKVVLSSIFKWYVRDFGGSERAMLGHIAGYAEGNLGTAIGAGPKAIRYDYDWWLNDWL